MSVTVDAILFDMDGTLVDSTPAAEYTFEQLCKAHGIDAASHPHGVRMVDSMKKWFPEASESDIAAMARKFEDDLLLNAQDFVKQGKSGIVILPGVQDLLAAIRSHPNAEESYIISTSATRQFASQALQTAGIRAPAQLVTADDCTHGKPHPEPYLRAAKLLGKDPARCVVIEDAPAGIRAGLAAGATVIAVCTSHKREQLEGVGAHYIVNTLQDVKLRWTEQDKMELTLTAQ